MIVHRLRHPVARPDLQLNTVTLRRPVERDKQAIVAEADRTGVKSNLGRCLIVIAQLSGLPIEAVRSLSRIDGRELSFEAVRLLKEEGLL